MNQNEHADAMALLQRSQRVMPVPLPGGMTAVEVVPTRGDRVLAWAFILIVLSVAAALAAVALCGAAVVVKLTADFVTH